MKPPARKNRVRLVQRLTELHEGDKADAQQFRDLAISAFAPIVVSVSVAAVISLQTWLKPRMPGLETVLVGVVLLATMCA